LGVTPERTELLELYKIAVEEYRFEVRLNWDRMRYYVALNATLLGVGIGLLRLEGGAIGGRVLSLLVFIVGIVACRTGRNAVAKGQEYYHRAVSKKTFIESLLGIAGPVEGYPTSLAIGTTAGMTRTPSILDDTERWLSEKRPKKGSIVYYVTRLLLLIAWINGLGAAVAGVQTYQAVRASESSSTSTPPTATHPAITSPPAAVQPPMTASSTQTSSTSPPAQ